MKLFACSLKDCAIQAFMVPQFVSHKQALIRAIQDGLKGEKKMDYQKHPEDFELYEVGSFDDTSGEFTPCEPALIVRLKDLVAG